MTDFILNIAAKPKNKTVLKTKVVKSSISTIRS